MFQDRLSFYLLVPLHQQTIHSTETERDLKIGLEQIHQGTKEKLKHN